MNEIMNFEFDAKPIRIVDKDGEPWFVGRDVAEALGYTNTAGALLKHVDEDDRDGIAIRDSIGRMQQTPIINESGLYSLILSSKLESAKRFKRWVTSEVLPSIKKHGGYLTPAKVEEALLNPDTLIQLATALKEERAKRAQLEAQREKDHPKVLFADSVCASSTSILIGDLAKILKQNGIDTGGTRLFEQLRKDGYLISRKGSSWNMPTQRSMDLGLMEVKESAHTNSDGSIVVTKTTKVTGKGQVYFINKYRNQPVLPLLEVG